jgi:hypothetical protein
MIIVIGHSLILSHISDVYLLQFEMLYGQTAAALFAKAAELQREARCHSVGGAGCPGLTGE